MTLVKKKVDECHEAEKPEPLMYSNQIEKYSLL